MQTDNELIEILRANEWARGVFEKMQIDQVNQFHACHGLITECFATMLRVDIESARAVTNIVLGNLLMQLRVPQPMPEAAPQEPAAEPASSIVPLNRSLQ